MNPSAPLDAVLAQARALEKAGQLAAAAAALDAQAAAFATSGLWHYARGAIAFRLGQAEAALAHFEAAVKHEPEVAEYRSNLGAALLDQARRTSQPEPLARALVELTEALRWGPSLPSTRVNLGLACLMSGQPAQALGHFDRALADAPGDLAALYNRAAALKQLGRAQECVAALDQVLALQPGFAPAVQARAQVTASSGRP